MQTLLEIHDWINTPTMREMGFSIDKNTLHTYIDVYEKLFSSYRTSRELNLLEIGVSTGASLVLWSKYFSPTANIEGVDVQFEELAKKEALNTYLKAKLILGNSTSKDFTQTLGKYDIIIDDGSHEVKDQIKTFRNMIGHLNVGGIYVIEDINGNHIDSIKQEIPDGQILDRRYIKNRWDDVMLIYRKEAK